MSWRTADHCAGQLNASAPVTPPPHGGPPAAVGRRRHARPHPAAPFNAICGAGYGQRSDERVNRRNGYRERTWDTRAGTVELAIPKLRSGSYFPEWLPSGAAGPTRP
ncbi:hypothetical protein Acsp04_51000 [Actinomadura sp. NBRC 104425]|nr:hypothetical protein Acsp04_51000 [Actinomadura sp. NBRC 104425]